MTPTSIQISFAGDPVSGGAAVAEKPLVEIAALEKKVPWHTSKNDHRGHVVVFHPARVAKEEEAYT